MSKVMIHGKHVGVLPDTVRELDIRRNEGPDSIAGYKPSVMLVELDGLTFGVTQANWTAMPEVDFVTTGLIFKEGVLIAHPSYAVDNGDIVPTIESINFSDGYEP